MKTCGEYLVELLAQYGVEVDGPEVPMTDLEALKALAKPTPLIDDPGH